MFETALKTALASALSRRLPAAVLIVLSQTIAWSPIAPTARAATDPESEPVSNPSATASTTSDASAATASNIASAYSAATGITGPTTPFHDSVASRYNYAFGKDAPFLPSNATSSNGQFLSPRSFYTAQYCGHCHQEAYRQWRQSVHSNSFRAPWYLKNVNLLIDEKGVQYSRHCEGCHNPVALLSGDLSQGMPKKRSPAPPVTPSSPLTQPAPAAT
jgi:hypothetical protein